MFIPFSPPHIDQKIIDEIVNTLKSGWITTGPKTRLFEQKLTSYYNGKATLCVSSATTGLEIMMRWFGVEEGDEVIIPAYTYCATANAVLHCGAKPVMVDVNKDDFNISIDAIRNAITGRTKVIIPVDIAGFPCDYDLLLKLVREQAVREKFSPATENQKQLGRILVLEDAAHSLGAHYRNLKIGSVADVTVFSFHAVKNLTTAEGGAIALNLPDPFDNQEIYRFLNVLCLHGQDKDALAKTGKGAWKYDVVCAGYKANMTDILASIGLVEIDRYDKDNLIKRRQIFQMYSEAFANHSWAETPVYETEEKTSSYHIYLLRIRNITEEQRDQIIKRIFEREVSVNVHFKPLPMFTFYKSLGYDISKFPVSYDNFSRVITLPVYYNLNSENVRRVIQTVIEAVESVL